MASTFILLSILASIFAGKSSGARGLDQIHPMPTIRDNKPVFQSMHTQHARVLGPMQAPHNRVFGPMRTPDLRVFGPNLSPAPSKDAGEGQLVPGIKRLRMHHKSNKSVAAADVILGGYATAFVAAIVCYIRVTRKNKDAHS